MKAEIINNVLAGLSASLSRSNFCYKEEERRDLSKCNDLAESRTTGQNWN